MYDISIADDRALKSPLCEGFTPPAETSNGYRKSFEVRWDDVDINGHLRSTRYLEYAGTTRIGHLTDVGWSIGNLQREGITAVLLGEEGRYLREVFLSECVEGRCSCFTLGQPCESG